MGGSSLAPEVIAQTSGVPLVILDSTAPGQVLAAIDGDAESGGLTQTVLVVSSKSGSTVETDSAKRAFEAAFRDLGIDPAERIVVVTDPGSPSTRRPAPTATASSTPTRPSAAATRRSPLSASCRPASRASTSASCSTRRGLAARGRDRQPRQPGARARAPPSPAATRGATSSVSSPTARTSSASPTGSSSSSPSRPARTAPASCRSCSFPSRPRSRTRRRHADRPPRRRGERVPLPRAARGRDPHQRIARRRSSSCGSTRPRSPAACSASTRSTSPTSNRRRSPRAACWTPGPSRRRPRSRWTASRCASRMPALAASGTVAGVLDALWARSRTTAMSSIQAYVDRLALPQLQGLRELVAADSGRPTTFGWGPRFLHSTGQFHKGGPADRRLPADPRAERRRPRDPGRPFTFGQLIEAQAAGDARCSPTARAARGHADPHRPPARGARALRSRPVGDSAIT